MWACVAVGLTAWATPALATPGALDPTFSGDGRVAVIPPSDETFVARAVALQPDGRILVAGFSCAPAAGADGTCLVGGGSTFRIARLTTDGGLDAEFGRGGFVTTPIGTRSQAYDVLVGANGSIVAGGLARVDGRDVFALARYDRRGALDAAFGDGGRTTLPVGVGFGAIAALAPGPDGSVYAAGQAVDGAGRRRMAIARVTASGALDTTWGDGGTRISGPPYGYVLGITGGEGGVTVGGVGGDSPAAAGLRFGLGRLDVTGAPDLSFGSGGSALFGPGTSASFANALAPAPGGGWIAGGVATGPDNRQAMTVLRGTRMGALDPGFGAGGVTFVGGADGAAANDVLTLPDGRLIAVGQVAVGGGYRFGAARLSATGAPDAGFGSGGLATVGFDGYSVARAIAGVVQPDGGLVTVGVGCVGSGASDCTGGTAVLLAARQLGDPPQGAAPAGPGPTPTPSPQPAVTPRPKRPAVKVSRLAKRITRKRLVARGIRLQVRTSSKVRARAALSGRRRTGKRRRFVLARDRVRRSQRSFALRLRPGRRAARAVRRGRLRVQLRVRTPAGAHVTRTFTVRLR